MNALILIQDVLYFDNHSFIIWRELNASEYMNDDCISLRIFIAITIHKMGTSFTHKGLR